MSRKVTAVNFRSNADQTHTRSMWQTVNRLQKLFLSGAVGYPKPQRSFGGRKTKSGGGGRTPADRWSNTNQRRATNVRPASVFCSRSV